MSTPYQTPGQPSGSQITQPASSQSQSSQQTISYAYPLSAGQQPYATPAQISQPVAGTSAGASGSSIDTKTQPTKQTTEEAKKDRTLAEFLLMLDDYEPLIPDEVTDYYLQRVGFDCQDARLKRLLALAAQKFVSDIAADAYQYARIRSNAAGGRARGNQPPTTARDKARTTLTMEDLGSALAEYGINSRKPEFYM